MNKNTPNPLQSQFEKLWQLTTGIPEVRVAIIDGSADLQHPCLVSANLTQASIFGSSEPLNAPTQHGTSVTSIIMGQHQHGIYGIAPNVSGTVIPIFFEDEKGVILPASQLDLARAIDQAIDLGAHIINISGGELDETGEPEGLLAQALEKCQKNNILVVAATGNNGCQCLHIPAASPAVLAVGAMDESGQPLDFSNWGSAYQINGILAHGKNLSVALSGGGITQKTGTSFATPVVSGAAALLLSLQKLHGKNPDPLAISKALLQSAIPCPDHSKNECQKYLAGLLDLPGALELLFQHDQLISSNLKSNQTTFINHKKNNIMDNLSENTTEVGLTENDLSNENIGIHVAELPEINPIETNLEYAAKGKVPVLTPSGIEASDCGCGGKTKGNPRPVPQIAYALGNLGFDFATETRRDSFLAANVNVYNPQDVLTHLQNNTHETGELIWTLSQESIPIYAIYPLGPFAHETYKKILELFESELVNGADRVSIPGMVSGKTTLLSGQVVPTIIPSIRGMFSWNTPTLVELVFNDHFEKDGSGNIVRDGNGIAKLLPQYDTGGADHATHLANAADLSNFLERIYYELRNLGVSPQDRAINFSATNAFQAGKVFQEAFDDNMQLSNITAERSPTGRPGTISYDVKLIFFDPAQRFNKAKKVYRWTVDVSEEIPVQVGKVRDWFEY